jgi:hypothetical protein
LDLIAGTYIGGYIDFRQKKVQRGLSIEANTPGPPLVGGPSFSALSPGGRGGRTRFSASGSIELHRFGNFELANYGFVTSVTYKAL